MWTPFVVGLMAGLVTTPHCLGMCGGFPLHLARASGERNVFLKQLLFVVGKTFTYMFLGTLAAAVGVVLLKDTKIALSAPLLRIFAGVITLVFGLSMVGVKLPSFKPLQEMCDTGLVKSTFGSILSNPTPGAALALGLGVGFLPCPLPMAMLAASAASQSVLYGILVMAGVGVGTSPGLLAVGLCGVGLDKKFSSVGMRVAGVLVIVIGLFTLAKATGLVHVGHPMASLIPNCCGGGK